MGRGLRCGHPSYTYGPDDEDCTAREEIDRVELSQHPIYGSQTRARTLLSELRDARQDEARIAARGPGTDYTLDPAQRIVRQQLGTLAFKHEMNLRALDRKAQAVVTRRLYLRTKQWLERINPEDANPSNTEEENRLWEQAREETMQFANRVSTALDATRFEMMMAAHLRDHAVATADALEIVLTLENRRTLATTYSQLRLGEPAEITNAHRLYGGILSPKDRPAGDSDSRGPRKFRSHAS
ncbi:hypothetical protein B0H11DRAFT_1934140 [Mycena galericulata]|nr:hypothetical protein B0H11DRAFT_1934140 [Mycena galericulata]